MAARLIRLRSGPGVLQVGAGDLEALGKGRSECADGVREGRLDLLVGRTVQGGVGGELFQAEVVNALLQAYRDG
ncbi:hypothetical protein GCM10010372_04600 [Streptomyces tauricus]|nr:hypothetical protein GCM10010372_04600 [Streptomyces tauricus]